MSSNELSREEEHFVLGVIKWGVAIIATIVLLFMSMYQIKEQEQAVVVTFGRAQEVTEPGLHFKVPFVQKVKKVNTTIQGFPMGFRLVDKRGNTFSEGTTDYPEESLMITSDYNFVNIDFFVEYKFANPVATLYASEDPVGILKNVCQSCIRSTISAYTVDDVLTNGKNEIQAVIKARITEELSKQDIGIQLVNITIQDSEPPTEDVMQAFKAVETAKQQKETIINEANKYRNEKLPEAQAKADGVVKEAEAQKAQRINEATAQVARFSAMYEEYVKNPGITKQRMYYEAMEEVLPNLKVIIESKGSDIEVMYPVESFAQYSTNTEGN